MDEFEVGNRVAVAEVLRTCQLSPHVEAIRETISTTTTTHKLVALEKTGCLACTAGRLAFRLADGLAVILRGATALWSARRRHGEGCDIDTLTLLHAHLRVLCAVLIDPEAVAELGRIGGHTFVLEMSESLEAGFSELCEAEEDLQEAVGEVTALCCAANRAFPVRKQRIQHLVEIPFRYNFQHPCARGRPPIDVLVRGIAERQECQYTVGYVMWSAAIVMSQWVMRHSERFAGRRCLEVGAGLGLCGFVASHFCSRTVLTDFNGKVVDNLRYNAALNSSMSSTGEPCGVRRLDWDLLPRQPGTGSGVGTDADSAATDAAIAPCDVIIATDMVCQDSDAHGIVRVLQTFLAPGPDAFAFFVLPTPHSRFGVGLLSGLLADAGFTHTVDDITDPELLSDLQARDAEDFQYQFYTISR